MPRGHSLSIYERASGKRELHCSFLGKRVTIIISKHATTIFFSHYNLKENLKKNWLEKRA